VIVDGRSGVATATLTDPAALAELLVEARTNAADAGVDPTAAVASPDGVRPPDIELYDARIEALSVDDKADLALRSRPPCSGATPACAGSRAPTTATR
jgi:PmbA protein